MKVQRTLNWVLSQDSDSGSGSGASGHTTPEPGLVPGLPPPRMKEPAKGVSNTADVENNVSLDISIPPPSSKPFTVPTSTIHSALDSVWTADKGM